jgi:protein associated with RNAse G/E
VAGPLIVLDAVFQDDIDHDLLGRISRGTVSTEYYWTDRWYNVFRFSDPDRKLIQFYCNINLPPVFDGKVLKYVDLDIDMLVQPDLSYTILDLDDFEVSARLYSYSAALRSGAEQALRDLTALIESSSFPFAE